MLDNLIEKLNKGMIVSTYNMAIGLLYLWGLGVGAAVALKLTPHSIVAAIVCIAVSVAGWIISDRAHTAATRFVGYSLFIIPLAALLVSQGIIFRRAVLVAMFSVLLTAIGAQLYHKLFVDLKRVEIIMIALVVIISYLAGYVRSGTWWGMLISAAIVAYIGYRWHKAQYLGASMYNALYAAISLCPHF